MNKLSQAIAILERYIEDDSPRILEVFGCRVCAVCGREIESGQHEEWCGTNGVARALALLKECTNE